MFCDETTEQGFGLGARTMPETRRYSAVCALHTFWLAARAYGLGVGWVSILDPTRLAETLEVPSEWSFVGYLCVGWPQRGAPDPGARARRLAGPHGPSRDQAMTYGFAERRSAAGAGATAKFGSTLFTDCAGPHACSGG